ncbi:aldehyde dehydrogenase [Croceiramulus getboli]|nr:aldehyde dehydrogenase [Flavobacteriaceae bacterium YJPT1-3]
MSQDLASLHHQQRAYFASGKSRPLATRKACLQRLKKEISERQEAIHQALYADFKKPYFESLISESAYVLKEIDLYLKYLKKWALPERVPATLLNFPSRDYIYKEPYGCTLIISPWNYPFNLAMAPLIAAIAAGNTAVIKPSEKAPATAQILQEIVSAVFPPGQVSVVTGGKDVAQGLLALRWDYIFFTGSVAVGKKVAEAAAPQLTPLTLELGGKNPCIVDETANLEVAARRIVWGKFFNAGQTCLAPDYLLVHEHVKEAFVTHFSNALKKAYGEHPKTSEDFARIIDQEHFERLEKLLHDEKVLLGGATDPTDRYIAPTLVDAPDFRESELMEEEIFGPILPLLTYRQLEDLDHYVDRYAKPLSLYVFSTNKQFKNSIVDRYAFGGGVINDTLVHFVNDKLPFGGVGHSGMGAYHGKYGFMTFSHQKSVVKRGNWPDIPFRYAPYKKKMRWMKRLMKWL